jgi:hypothetical protein
MPHAGDALWQIWGTVRYLEKCGQQLLASQLRSSTVLIGQQLGVPPPPDDVAEKLSSALESLLSAPAVESAPVVGQPSKPMPVSTGRFSNPEMLSAVTTFVDMMVESDLFNWADMVTDIQQRLKAPNAFVTPKQCRALLNIASKGRIEDEDSNFDGCEWLEMIEDESPAMLKRVRDEAAKA